MLSSMAPSAFVTWKSTSQSTLFSQRSERRHGPVESWAGEEVREQIA